MQGVGSAVLLQISVVNELSVEPPVQQTVLFRLMQGNAIRAITTVLFALKKLKGFILG